MSPFFNCSNTLYIKQICIKPTTSLSFSLIGPGEEEIRYIQRLEKSPHYGNTCDYFSFPSSFSLCRLGKISRKHWYIGVWSSSHLIIDLTVFVVVAGSLVRYTCSQPCSQVFSQYFARRSFWDFVCEENPTYSLVEHHLHKLTWI